MGDPTTYLDNSECRRLWNLFLRLEAAPTLNDKLLFERSFGSVPDVRIPRHVGHLEHGVFHFADGAERAVTTGAEFAGVLDELLNEVRAEGGTSLFAKPRTGLKGDGAFLLPSATPEPAVWEAVQKRGYVFQQTVEQHPALAAVSPDTLNTMRIMTLRRGTEEPEAVSAWIRIGRRGAVVDNASAGGLFNRVDLGTGQLPGPSMTKFEQGGGFYTRHPDTGHPLVGFEVPEFEACLEMARAAARHIEYPIVGWDVGVTPNGPVVIEGNSDANYMSDETANRVGYLVHPVLGPFIRESLETAKATPPSHDVPYADPYNGRKRIRFPF